MWNLSAEDRLAEWRDFRKEMGALPFDEAVKQTVHKWSYAPFVGHYLDRQSPNDWPSPWELVADGKFDDLAKALGMLYTLALSTHGTDHTFSLAQMTCSSCIEVYNVVIIDDGKYVLNYVFDEIIPSDKLEPSITVNQELSSEDLHLSRF